MQTPKKRGGSSELPQRASPLTPQSACKTKAVGSGTNSPSSTRSTAKTPTGSPKTIQHRSPRSPASEKKRITRVSELESQLTQLQEELNKTKNQLGSSESWKERAQQEAEEAKKQLSAMTAKFEDSQDQLFQLSASEEARVQELRKLSQERDRAWQSELEAVQQQHSMDSSTLVSAMNEIQKLKLQLGMVAESEDFQAKQAEVARTELEALKHDMAVTLSMVEELKAQLSDREKCEAEYQELLIDAEMQLEMTKKTSDTLHSDGLKAMESLSAAGSELEQSKAQVKSLEEMVRNLQRRFNVEDGSLTLQDPIVTGIEPPQNAEISFLQSEVEHLKSALEAAEIRYQEEQTQSTVKIQSAYEAEEHTRVESSLREAKLELALKETESELAQLKLSLSRKEAELQGVSDSYENLHSEMEKSEVDQIRSQLELKLKNSIEHVADLKANLMDKETELQGVLEENEILKLDMEEKESEWQKSRDSAMAEVESVKAAEKEALVRLGLVSEEADKSSRRSARLAEQLDAAQVTISEMEAELRRLRVQSDQWRKAAEAAAAMLTTGNNGRMMDRSGSMDSGYHPLPEKLMSSPYADDFDDNSPKKNNNNNVLRKIGVLWKKGQK